MNISIVCTCDESYLPLLKVFLNSLNINSDGEYNFCIRLINVPTTPEFLNQHQIIHDNTQLDTTRNKLINEGMLLHDFVADSSVKRNRESIYRGARWLYSDMMAYCANIKFKTINEMLNKGHDVFYFDVDTIVRKDLTGFFNMLTNFDIMIKMTPSNPSKPFSEPYTQLYHTGLIGIKNNSKTKKFFKLLEYRCEQSDFFNWDTDQIEFANIIERDKFDVTISNIDDTYKDEFYDNESHIWCGAAAGKTSNIKYIEEMNSYNES